MASFRLAFRDVSFQYEGGDPLFSDLTVHFPVGFTGIIGANGTGKSTLLKVALGELEPDEGNVQRSGEVVYCPQRTDDPPAMLDAFLAAEDGYAYGLRGRLGVEPDFSERWASLSHGERKRAQIGAALWLEPTVLAIDEPTNHIDSAARQLLLDELVSFRGVGLIVSHDRDLLDTLVSQCVWLEPPTAEVYAGGYTTTRELREAEREVRVREREKATRERDRIQREVVKRREKAARSHKDRSKRGLKIGDHDARFKKNLARVTGKDGQAGRLLRQLDGRAKQAQERADAARVDKHHELGIWLPGSLSKRSALLTLDETEIPLGSDRRHLAIPPLTMAPSDRIAIRGPNGSGKSTLLRHVLPRLNVEADRITSIPQEIDAATGAGILSEAQRLPRDRLGQVMRTVSRLGSRPERLLSSRNPSPGEIRKLMLALGMSLAPHIVVMDEPTNHLDLPSIECLEEALAECPCGLLLVSHDERFLERLTETQWRIESADGIDSTLHVETVS